MFKAISDPDGSKSLTDVVDIWSDVAIIVISFKFDEFLIPNALFLSLGL